MKNLLLKIDKTEFGKERYLAIYILLALIIIASTYAMTIRYNMHISTQESLHLYFAKYAAAAISNIEYGLNIFVGYNNIFDPLMNHGTLDDGILKQALDVKDYASGGIFKIYLMDLGYSVYAKIAFLIFGYKVSSFLYLYFLTILFSSILFIIEFKKNKSALSLLILFLLAFYLTGLKTVDMPYNASIIYAYRFMSILALLPLLHITLFIFNDQKLEKKNIYSTLILIIQSIIVVSTLYIRLSAKWMIIATLSLAFIIFLKSLKKHKINRIKEILLKSLPVFLFLSVFIFSKLYMHYSTKEHYSENGEGAHIFWHSIYVGLALHPEIRKEYTNERPPEPGSPDTWFHKSLLRLSDEDGYTAAFRWLNANGKDEFAIFNFNKNDNVDYKHTFSYFKNNLQLNSTPSIQASRKNNMENDFNWVKYDAVIKEIVFDVFKKYPLQIIETTLILKPIKFFYIYLNDFMKLRDFKSIKTFIQIERILLFIVLLFVTFMARDSLTHLTSTLIPLTYLFSFSMITPIAIYAEPWNIADQSIILTMIIYIFVIKILAFVFEKSKKLLIVDS